MLKTVIVATLLILSFSYTEEKNGLLVLEDSDFPGILKFYSHIMIEFYAPW